LISVSLPLNLFLFRCYGENKAVENFVLCRIGENNRSVEDETSSKYRYFGGKKAEVTTLNPRASFGQIFMLRRRICAVFSSFLPLCSWLLAVLICVFTFGSLVAVAVVVAHAARIQK